MSITENPDPYKPLNEMFKNDWDHGQYFTILTSDNSIPFFEEYRSISGQLTKYPDKPFIVLGSVVYALLQPTENNLPDGINVLMPVRVEGRANAEKLMADLTKKKSWSGLKWFPVDMDNKNLVLYWLNGWRTPNYVFTSKEDFFLYIAYRAEPERVMANLHDPDFRTMLITQTETLWSLGTSPYQLMMRER